MGIFDSLMKAAENTIKKEATKVVTGAAQSIGKGKNRSERFTFSSLPTSLSKLQALPEATLDSPFKTVALTLAKNGLKINSISLSRFLTVQLPKTDISHQHHIP